MAIGQVVGIAEKAAKFFRTHKPIRRFRAMRKERKAERERATMEQHPVRDALVKVRPLKPIHQSNTTKRQLVAGGGMAGLLLAVLSIVRGVAPGYIWSEEYDTEIVTFVTVTLAPILSNLFARKTKSNVVEMAIK